ncbi:MAG: hypothetical protein AAF514_22670 [Verrucomicrobiota bacterium]
MKRFVWISGVLLPIVIGALCFLLVGGTHGAWSFAGRVLLLTLVPFVLPTVLGGWAFRDSPVAQKICLFSIGAIFLFLGWLIIDILHLNPDAQGGLALIFGPFYALVGSIPFAVLALAVHLRKKNGGR